MPYLESPVLRFLHIVGTGILTVSTCDRFFLKALQFYLRLQGAYLFYLQKQILL